MHARPSSRDDALIRRVAAGDERAWEVLDRRHRPALRRYVAALARRGAVDADDVVQEVLLRAHRELGAGFAPDHLSAWLHRSARNATIDAVRALARRPTDALGPYDAVDRNGSPEPTVLRRERLRQLVHDVGRLPEAQRRALLRRAVDGRPAAEVARELGMTEPAVHMAVRRAREGLMRTSRARDARCEEIRPLLHTAHGRGARPTETARLHLQDCPACRDYRRELRRVDRRLRALVPPLLPLAGLVGGGATTAGLGAKSAAVVGALALATTGGVLVEHHGRLGPGDPSPVELQAGFASRQTVRRGGPLPAGTYVVQARVRLPGGLPPVGVHRSVTLTCPAGTRAAAWAGLPKGPQKVWMTKGTEWKAFGERRVRVVFQRVLLPGPWTTRVGVVCRRPDATGAVHYRARATRPGETPMLTTPGRHYLHRTPGGMPWSMTNGREPVSVLRTTKSGLWSYIVGTDPNSRGWIQRRLLRPRPGVPSPAPHAAAPATPRP